MRAKLALLLTAVFVVAGCGGGGGDKTAGGGGEAAGASIVPADVAAFVSITTDETSDQWKQADELLKKFPGREQLLTSIKSQLGEEGIDFERDLRPALGPETDLVVFRFEQAGETLVGMTKPEDPDKLMELLKKADDPPTVVVKRDDGWVVFSDAQASVDRIGAEGPKLADSEAYQAALEQLPEEALATAWVDGKATVNAIKQQAGGADLGDAGKLEWVAAALEARPDGAAVEIAAKGVGENAETFQSSLLDKVPADTLLFATFKGLDKGFGQIEKQAGPAGALVESFVGVPLRDLIALFSGEVTVYARSGTPLPEVTLVLDGENADAKLATLGKLAAKAVTAFGARGPAPTTVEGTSLQELRFGPFAVLYGLAEGRIVITDTRNAIRDLRGGAANSLADDATFKAAKEAAGMPDENNGFLYVNLKDSISEISGLAGENLTPEVEGNLRPLRTLLAYSTVDGDVIDVTVFVEIK
jgi:uncharacterized protein DUF3352